jgi:hypothetical protein
MTCHIQSNHPLVKKEGDNYPDIRGDWVFTMPD